MRKDEEGNIDNKGKKAIKFLFPFELIFAQLKRSLNAIASRPWISIKCQFTELQFLHTKFNNNSRHLPKHVFSVDPDVA